MEEIEASGQYRKLLDEQDWSTILEDLAIYVGIYYKHIQPADREDFVYEAIKKVYTGEQAWNHTRQPNILDHLKWVLKSVISNELRRAYRSKRAEDIVVEDGTKINPIDIAPDTNPLQDEVLITKERLKEIQEAIKDDEEAELIFAAYEDGARKPSEAVKITGYNIETVRNALKRIRRRIVSLRK